MIKRPLPNVEWRKYLSINNDVLNEYLNGYGDDFLQSVLHKVSQAHTNNLPSIILIEFVNSNIVAVVEQSDYPLILKQLLNLCERLEKYEICSDIVKQQRRMKKRTLTTKKSHKQSALI